MQSTHRKYPAAKNSTQYLTIRQTTHLRADLLHFPGPKKLPKLVALKSILRAEYSACSKGITMGINEAVRTGTTCCQ